jgi:type IV pilus assembly protein PilW
MKTHCRTPYTNKGFTLVELMVAMVIGLLILVAVSTIMINSNKNYNTTDSTARLQENARFAIQFITSDLRRAGYFGCSDDMSVVNSTLNGGGVGAFALNALEGAEDIGTGAWEPSGVAAPSTSATTAPAVAGTDGFAIRYLDLDNAVSIQQQMPNESAVLFVNAGHGLKTNDIIAVTDCDTADVMQLTDVNASGSSGKDNLVHNAGAGSTPGNSTQKLSKSYSTTATILKMNAAQYYIGRSASGTTNSLYRITLNGTEELVEGVDNMQILYGIVTTADRVPSTYVDANNVGSNWGNVISVRVGLLLSTIANTTDGQFSTDKDTKIHNVNGENIGPIGDSRTRQVFDSTIMLRNIK